MANESFFRHQALGLILRPDSSIRSALLTLAICYLLVIASTFLAALPAYFGPLNFETQYRFEGVPEDFSLPFSARLEAGQGLRSIHCTASAETDPTAIMVADCRGVTDSFSDAFTFLEQQGIEVRNEFSNISMWPAFGGYRHALFILGMGVLIGAGWSWQARRPVAADLAACRDACLRRPWLLLVPYALMATTLSIVGVIIGFDLPKFAPYSRVWELVLYGVVAAPVLEEIVFRGVVYDVLNRRLTWLASGVLSSVLFAAVHTAQTGNAGSLLGLMAGGFGLYWLRKETDSVALCILAHAIVNALVLGTQLRWAAALA